MNVDECVRRHLRALIQDSQINGLSLRSSCMRREIYHNAPANVIADYDGRMILIMLKDDEVIYSNTSEYIRTSKIFIL